MEDEGSNSVEVASTPTKTEPPSPTTETQLNGDPSELHTNIESDGKNKDISTNKDENEGESQGEVKDHSGSNNDESGVVLDASDASPLQENNKEMKVESCEGNDDVRSLGDLDSLPAGDELALGAAGSDSGVEGCGRALSSGGGSRSCASSVVSCGSGCGSESSSLAGAPPRPRRRVNVTVEPKRSSPVGASTPRPVTAPRGPNLATRERARSREKPTPPEKPRPLTPKPRIRPTGELPNLVRESPALRAKPTKTSTARCRTPNSPSEEKRWPAVGARLASATDASAARLAADKYGTLPRRRRDPDTDGSPKHEAAPPSRRPVVARSASSRSAVRTRVRIYAEKTSQTVLLGTDIEAAFNGILPNIETRAAVSTCSRGVQACGRSAEAARAAALQAAVGEERAARQAAERALGEERAARAAALAELARNQRRLVELAGAAAAGGPPSADACLRALDEQLRAASERAAAHRTELDLLRDTVAALHAEAAASRERARLAEARLAEAEREAHEMQDFLAAETSALSQSLQDADAEVARLNAELDRSRGECRQLVRMCEQRRQEALAAAARARGGAGRALDALARRLARLTVAVTRAYRLPPEPEPTVFHNDAFSRSDSGEALTPEEEARPAGLLAAVSRALRAAQPAAPQHTNDDDLSRMSDEYDNSADLLDSETEPCLVTDQENAEEWWSGAECAGAWSGDELSPERESYPDEIDKDCESGSASERESLRTLSAAIAVRQRQEAADGRGALAQRVAALDARLAALHRALRRAASLAPPAPPTAAHAQRLAHALRDQIEVTENNVADVVVKKLAELDATKNMMEQYRQSVETLKTQLAQTDEDENLDILEEEVSSCSEAERRARYAALDAALGALAPAAPSWPRLKLLAARLERLAFVLAAPSPSPPPPPHRALDVLPSPAPLHTTA